MDQQREAGARLEGINAQNLMGEFPNSPDLVKQVNRVGSSFHVLFQATELLTVCPKGRYSKKTREERKER